MLARVSATSFRLAILYLLSAGKCNINFRIVNGELSMQRLSVTYVEMSIPILEYDTDDVDITVNLDSSMNLLNDKEDVYIDVTGDLFTVKQTWFEYGTQRVSEERILMDLDSCDVSGSISTYEIYKLVSASKTLDNVAKECIEALSDITIFDKTAYVSYNNVKLAVKTSLPNMRIQANSIRECNTFMKDGDIEYRYDTKKKILYLLSGKVVNAVSVLDVDKKVVGDFKLYESKVLFMTSVDFGKYNENLSILVSNYKKVKINLTFVTGGIRVFVDNLRSRFTMGDDGEGLFTIIISTSQLSLLTKLFGKDGRIEIAKGENYICLKNNNSNKTLLISGMTY